MINVFDPGTKKEIKENVMKTVMWNKKLKRLK